MKVKVVKECWYGEKHYIPELEVKDIIIEYPCKKAEDLPSWAEVATAKEVKNVAGGEGDKDNDGNDGEGDTKGKVKDLPIAERNLLIEKAAKVGISGNQILSWKVETLEAKIASKIAETAKNKEEGDDKDNDGNDGEGDKSEGSDE